MQNVRGIYVIVATQRFYIFFLVLPSLTTLIFESDLFFDPTQQSPSPYTKDFLSERRYLHLVLQSSRYKIDFNGFHFFPLLNIIKSLWKIGFCCESFFDNCKGNMVYIILRMPECVKNRT